MNIVTAEELAAFLKCGKSTVYWLAKTGRIPCLSLGVRGVRFNLSTVLAALEQPSTEIRAALSHRQSLRERPMDVKEQKT